MRSTWCMPAVVLLLGAVPLSRAEEPSAAHAVIDKAIKAVGGEEKLAKFKAQTWKETGTYHGTGTPLPYKSNLAVQWPAQFRMEIEGFFTIVLNGDKGWIKQGEDTQEMTKDQLT